MNKIENSPFDPFVKWFFPELIPLVPRWLSANGISYIGIFVSCLTGLVLVLSYLSPWMYVLASFFILSLWVTDTMDGIIARHRKQTSSLGFYLDHFGDAITVICIGIGMFATNGAHIEIGFAATVVYLLFSINVHIKTMVSETMELPFFGPTEVRFLIILVLIGQITFDYGKALSWFPAITGKNGWLTKFLGFDTGLTFIDICGILAVLIGVIALIIEVVMTVKGLIKDNK